MGSDVLDALLAAFPLPTLAIDEAERIISANTEAQAFGLIACR